MRILQVHYITGNGRREERGRPVDFSVPEQDLTERMINVKRMVTRRDAHSVSVFDVTDGKRVNVTTEFVPFETRPEKMRSPYEGPVRGRAAR